MIGALWNRADFGRTSFVAVFGVPKENNSSYVRKLLPKPFVVKGVNLLRRGFRKPARHTNNWWDVHCRFRGTTRIVVSVESSRSGQSA